MVNLNNFFKPKSIVVIGASRNPNKVGHVLLKNLVDSGFKGSVFAVNKNAEKILDYISYKSVLNIKEKIDLAIIAIPSQFVLQVVIVLFL